MSIIFRGRLGLSIGAFDADRIQGSVSVRVTVGNERFCPIGVTQSKTVEAEHLPTLTRRTKCCAGWISAKEETDQTHLGHPQRARAD